MAEQQADLFERLVREQSGPLGHLRIASNKTLLPFSKASQEAANNLLLKAYDGLAKGDEERAIRFTQRAAALAWDPHEATFPGAWSVQMLLFDAVVDEAEACDLGDTSWLDAAEAALDVSQGWGRSELAHCLRVIQNDYELGKAETKRIQRLTSGEPDDGPIGDLTGATEAELAAAILSVLRTVRAYDEACDALG